MFLIGALQLVFDTSEKTRNFADLISPKDKTTDEIQTYETSEYFRVDRQPFGELSEHSPIQTPVDYPANLITMIQFQHYSNDETELRMTTTRVATHVEFEIYGTIWRLDGTNSTEKLDTWKYHSADHTTKTKTVVLPGEYVTWQIKPIALQEPITEWNYIRVSTLIRSYYSEVIE